MAQVLKFWHKWSWLFHIGWMSIIVMTYVFDYKNSMANNTLAIAEMQQTHKEENMKERMAVQESTSRDVKDTLTRIEMVQGKIFDRINQLSDKRSQ